MRAVAVVYLLCERPKLACKQATRRTRHLFVKLSVLDTSFLVDVFKGTQTNLCSHQLAAESTQYYTTASYLVLLADHQQLVFSNNMHGLSAEHY